MSQGSELQVFRHISKCSDSLNVIFDPDSQFVIFFCFYGADAHLYYFCPPQNLQYHDIGLTGLYAFDQFVLVMNLAAVDRQNIISCLYNLVSRFVHKPVCRLYFCGPDHIDSIRFQIDPHRNSSRDHSLFLYCLHRHFLDPQVQRLLFSFAHPDHIGNPGIQIPFSI